MVSICIGISFAPRRPWIFAFIVLSSTKCIQDILIVSGPFPVHGGDLLEKVLILLIARERFDAQLFIVSLSALFIAPAIHMTIDTFD